MPTYSRGKCHSSNDRLKIGQLAAIWHEPQIVLGGGSRQRVMGLVQKSPTCQINHSQPYRVGSVSDCVGPSFQRRTRCTRVSVPATGAPSCRRTSTGRSDGAIFRSGGVTAESGGQFTYVQQSRRSTLDVRYRALRKTGCLENTLAIFPSTRDLPYPEGAEAIAPTFPAQFRGGGG